MTVMVVMGEMHLEVITKHGANTQKYPEVSFVIPLYPYIRISQKDIPGYFAWI
jgi:hypothetical protein